MKPGAQLVAPGFDLKKDLSISFLFLTGEAMH